MKGKGTLKSYPPVTLYDVPPDNGHDGVSGLNHVLLANVLGPSETDATDKMHHLFSQIQMIILHASNAFK